MSDLPPWKKIDSFRVDPHQRLVDKANKADRVTGSDDITVVDSGEGKSVHFTGGQSFILQAIGVIIPPEDVEHTYTDPRYRVQIARISYGDFPEDLIKLIEEDDVSQQPEAGTDPANKVMVDEEEVTPTGWTVTATNLVEITDPLTGAGTHTLPENGTVVVEIKCYYDRVDNKPIKQRWVFTSGATSRKGQYQHQADVMVSDNQEGWDAPRAHETLPNPI